MPYNITSFQRAFPDDPTPVQQNLILQVMNAVVDAREFGGVPTNYPSPPYPTPEAFYNPHTGHFYRLMFTGNEAPREGPHYYTSMLWEQEVAGWVSRGFSPYIVCEVLMWVDAFIKPVAHVRDYPLITRAFPSRPTPAQSKLLIDFVQRVDALPGATVQQRLGGDGWPSYTVDMLSTGKDARLFRLLLTGDEKARRRYTDASIKGDLTRWARLGFSLPHLLRALTLIGDTQ